MEEGIPASAPPRAKSKKTWWSWGLLVPVLVFFILMNVIPTIWMLGLSFYNYTLTSSGDPRFIGMDNYNQLASAGPLWLSLGRTFIFMVLAVAIQTVLGAVVGYLFWKSNKVPGRRVALTLLFLVFSGLWLWIEPIVYRKRWRARRAAR